MTFKHEVITNGKVVCQTDDLPAALVSYANECKKILTMDPSGDLDTPSSQSVEIHHNEESWFLRITRDYGRIT